MQGSSKLPKNQPNQPNQPNQLINPSIHREKKPSTPATPKSPKRKKTHNVGWQCQSPARGKETTYPRWFKVPFSSPSWRSLNPLKGSLNHHKKVTLNHQANCYCFSFKLSSLFTVFISTSERKAPHHPNLHQIWKKLSTTTSTPEFMHKKKQTSQLFAKKKRQPYIHWRSSLVNFAFFPPPPPRPTLALSRLRSAPVRTLHFWAFSSTKAPSPQDHWEGRKIGDGSWVGFLHLGFTENVSKSIWSVKEHHKCTPI